MTDDKDIALLIRSLTEMDEDGAAATLIDALGGQLEEVSVPDEGDEDRPQDE